MHVVEPGEQGSRPGARLKGWARGFVRVCFLLGLIAALLLTAGFIWFVRQVPDRELALANKADAIVVLTGGSSRVIDGIELLAAGHGRRLLISGVHRATNTGEISRVAPEYEQVLRCCVDLDRSALNTQGNATGTRRWVHDRGFRSLIVVTSNYHMPRAVAELSHQLPDVTLIPFPVLSDRMRAEPWWSSPGSTRLLLSEYLKYIYAVVRMRINPRAGRGADG
jgi:uncharacterized SAM-binding protein YcdF (DUF218 family)